MSKELVISATPHETRVAILEDGHLCEIYVEREKEFALVGSIYKGRVTRVLPGMQSAFVEIGLDSDAFLYVSDFLENLEEYDSIVSTVEGKVNRMEQQGGRVFAPATRHGRGNGGNGGYNGAPLPTEPVEVLGSAPADLKSYDDAPEAHADAVGSASGFVPAAEPPPASAETSHAGSTPDEIPFGKVGSLPGEVIAPRDPSAPNYTPPSNFTSSRSGRPFESRGRGRFDRGGRGGRDRGRGGRYGDRGDRGRRDARPPRHGGFPSSKYASRESMAGSPPGYFEDSAPPADNLEPIILPGESLAKYRDRAPAAAEPPGAGADSTLSALASPAPGLDNAPFQSESGHEPDDSAPQMEAGPDSGVSEPQGPQADDFDRAPSHHEAALRAEAVASFISEPAPATAPDYTGFSEADSHPAPPAPPAAPASAEDLLARFGSFESPRPHSDTPQFGSRPTHSAAEDFGRRPAEFEEAGAADAAPSSTAFAGDEEAADFDVDAAIRASEDFPDEAEGTYADGEAETEAEGEAETEEDAAEAAAYESLEAAGQSASAAADEAAPRQSARVEDKRRMRMQRPMRRGGDRRGGRRGAPRGRFHGRPMRPRQTQPISELLKAGQEIIVQIAKEPLGKKGARITSHVALPGRFLVYMPTVEHIGVSRKIGSSEDRARLRRLLTELKGAASGGFIVRTAAGSASDEDLKSDVDFLTRTWHEIRERSEQRKAPALLHRDLDLIERILRDHLSGDFTSIWIDNQEEFTKIVEFVGRFQPKLVNRVKLFTKEVPIFEEFGIQQEIDKSLRPKVWLKSGGYIVINHTEALVAIDVNTGKFVGKGSSRLEDTIVKTNLEAVKEIVRQIRLRDLGGIIVVDFIDMEERRNREQVMRALDEALRQDKAPSKVLPFNEFGLVCVTRKRTKQALERVLCQPCPYCTGSGMVKSIPTICYEIQAEARKMAPELDSQSLTLRVHQEIGKALKTRENALVEELERWTRKSVIIQSDPTLHWEQYDIY